MSKFRLKMDMSQFYDDERNLAYILVNPKWKQVLSLQEHVERLFDVEKVNFLTDDGVYIPSLESIDIIKSSDVLKAIIPQKIRKKKKSKSCTYNGFDCDEAVAVQAEKRKCNDEQMSCSTSDYRPNKKQRTAENALLESATENNLEIKQRTKLSRKGSPTDMVTSTNNSSNRVENSETFNVFAGEAEDKEETAKGRKRKRIRKKKNVKELLDEGDNKSNRLSSVPVPISSSTLRLSKSMSTPIKSPTHVHFDESLTLVEKSSEPKDEGVIFRSHLSFDEELEAREIAEEELGECTVLPNKPKIVIQENIVLVSAKNVEDFNDTSVIEVDDSLIRIEPDQQLEVTEETVTECLANEPSSSISIEKILPLSEPLVGLPVVGDIILFKMYRLSEAEVSENICGRCEELDSAKKTITCLVLDGLDQIDQTHSGFTQGKEELNYIQLSLDELLDKRIFRMS